MKEAYLRPIVDFVELKPEERLATCLKCPGKGSGTPGGNRSNNPNGGEPAGAGCLNVSKKS